MLWDPFLYCINDSIQGNSETGNKVFVLPSKVAINNLVYGKEDYDYCNKKRFNSTRLWNFFCSGHHKRIKKTYDC